MARTWSVPQRGSIAGISGALLDGSAWVFGFSGGRGIGHRSALLLVAALLTSAGVLVPHVDSQFLATVLFVAGAGLATLVVVLQWPTFGDAPEITAQGQNIACASLPSASKTCFPELLKIDADQPGLDRADWANLTAHMSHELRTPLNAVLGFSELMTSEIFGPLGSGYSSYARDIHASGRSLLKCAEDALAITALLTAPDRKGCRATSRLVPIIDEAHTFFAPDLTARGIGVEIDACADHEIVGDHQVTRQMLINLVAEATRNAASGAVLRIETNAAGGAINLAVRIAGDCASPVAEDGFGMILARTLCELSDAEMTVTSSSGGGRVWNVRLAPAMQADLFAIAA